MNTMIVFIVKCFHLVLLLSLTSGQAINSVIVDPAKFSYNMATTSYKRLPDQVPNVKCSRCRSSAHMDMSIIPLDDELAVVCNVQERDYGLVVRTVDTSTVTKAAIGQYVTSSNPNDNFGVKRTSRW